MPNNPGRDQSTFIVIKSTLEEILEYLIDQPHSFLESGSEAAVRPYGYSRCCCIPERGVPEADVAMEEATIHQTLFLNHSIGSLYSTKEPARQVSVTFIQPGRTNTYSSKVPSMFQKNTPSSLLITVPQLCRRSRGTLEGSFCYPLLFE